MGIFSQIKKRFEGSTKEEASKDVKTSKTSKVVKAAKAEKKTTKKDSASKDQVKASGNVVKFPDVTEKSALLQESGKYVFIVSDHATKPKVKRTIESMYDVKVSHVRMLNRKGKIVGNQRGYGSRSDVKKAIVTLQAGQSISIFDTEEK